MNVIKRAGIALAAATLATAGLAGGVASATTGPGGGGCSGARPIAHGSPGYTTFTLHVDTDDCYWPVQAIVMCTAPGGIPYYAYGPVVYGPGTTSKASCTGWAGSPYGYVYNDGNGWQEVVLQA